MQRRTIIASATIAALTLLAAGCANGTPTVEPSGEPADPHLTLRGSSNVSENTSFGKALDAFAECLATASEGSLELTMFHSAQLGSDPEALELVQIGALDFTSSTLTGNIVPEALVFDMPYVFDGYEHWVSVVDGEPGDQIRAKAAEQNYRILSFDLGGYRDTYSTSAINTIADFDGKKIRTLQSPAYIAFFEGLGSIPTPLAFTEVYLALQQGTLDGAETALPSMVDAKHYEVAKHVTLTGHGISSVAWGISDATWSRLSENQRDIVVTCDRDRVAMQRELQLADIASINEFLQGEGVTIVEMDTTELKELAARDVYPRIIDTPEAQAMLDAIKALSGN